MSKKDLEKTINQLHSVRHTRWKTVRNIGIAALFGVGGFAGGVTINKLNPIDFKPEICSTDKGELTSDNSQMFMALETARVNSNYNGMVGIAIFAEGAITLPVAGMLALNSWYRHRRTRREMVTGINILQPDWVEEPPSRKEIEVFNGGIDILPAVGGKIPVTDNGILPKLGYGVEPGKLPPTFTAEGQVDSISELVRKEKLGEAWSHQFGVQGKLPDPAKWMALALITVNVGRFNWKKAYFKAKWAEIAPMIHDGGNVDDKFNPVWKGVKGRTDFLARNSYLHEPGGSSMKGDRSVEEERLRIELRFYQRAALALHAASGTAPQSIPENIRKSLAGVWRHFEGEMRNIFEVYGVGDVGKATWFTDKPRYIPDWDKDWGERFEGDWPPIREELMNLERKREKSPQMRADVGMLMKETTEKVDKIIGLGRRITRDDKLAELFNLA